MPEKRINHSISREMRAGEQRRIADKMTAMAMVYCSWTYNVPLIKHYAVISERSNVFQGIADIRGIVGGLAVAVEPETVRLVTDPLTPDLFVAFQRKNPYPRPLRIHVICDESTGSAIREFGNAEISGSVITTQKKDSEPVVFFIEANNRVQSVFEERARLLAR